MNKKFLLPLIFYLFCSLTTMSASADMSVKGIYISQSTLENSRMISYLIKRAKVVGINTFVIDFNRMSPAYRNNIELVKDNHIHYVARIVVFPGGGLPYQVKSEAYWNKKYQLVEQAIGLGANEIQLDYIRYTQSMPPSHQNAQDIYAVIKFFKNKLYAQHVPLQIDVFGIASFGESRYIGQHIPLFADSVDAICPMLYPSHFEPYRIHAQQPYETVLTSLDSLRAQFDSDKLSFKLYPYIELFNYRYPLSPSERLAYIRAQIKATEDGRADGWYAWSAKNIYDNLFIVLEENQRHFADNKKTTSY